MVFLSLFWVGVYIYINVDGANPKLPREVQILSHMLGVVFLFDYLLRLFASPLRTNHFWSFFPMVDFLSLVPMVIELGIGNDRLTQISKQTDSLRQVASMLQAAKTIRILRAYRALKFIKSTVNRQMVATGLTVVCIIIAMAGILQILDQCSPACDIYMFCSVNFTSYDCVRNPICLSADETSSCCKCQELSFFDWVYFVVVSISTLGYGDISPRSRLGRLATSIMMLMTFVLVPIQVNRLVATISTHSGYTSSYKEHRTHTHGIITAGGEITPGTLANFLRQFFHPDNPNWNEKIVILHPTAPSSDVKRVIHLHEPRVQYIVGSAMNDLDLERAMISKAAVCYVLVNKDTRRPSNEDQSCTLLTAAFRGMNAAVPIYSQVFMSQNISHCILSGASGVICVEKLKLGVLGLNCTVWGLSTLLSNLLDTVSPSVTQLYPKDSWETAYLKGYVHEIHRVDIPRSFSGLTYRELILFLFGTIQVVPIAMLTDKGVEFAPMDFKLGATADPTICCTLYILASSVSVADQIAEYPLEQIRAKALPEDLSDHVVVVGLPVSLGDIVVPLRQYNARPTSPKLQSIVFIAPFGMTEHHFHSIGTDTTGIFFVQGSPLSSFDLQRIHIETASAIIILAGSGSHRKYVDENMVDADAITTVRYINEACSGSKPPNLIVELVKATNVKFMSSIVKRHKNRRMGRRTSDGRHTRLYASNSFKYDVSTPNAVLQKDAEAKIDVEHICEPSYASGRVYVSGMIDSLMSECYQKPNIIAAVNLLMFGSPSDPESQRVFQVPTPKSLNGKTFGECFRKVLALNLICIGCLHSGTETTPPYVHTNPPADTVIYHTDYLYLIGKPRPTLPL
ncbi:unnamed protein product [Aphanomyces euteiches]